MVRAAHGFFSVGAGVGQLIDVDNLAVRQTNGDSQIAYGDFGAAGARWFPTGRYYYFPWHVDNVLLETLLGQGMAGMLGLVLLLLLAGQRLLRLASREATQVAATAGALAGGATIGMLGSLQNSPRVMLLFWLVCVFDTRGRG